MTAEITTAWERLFFRPVSAATGAFTRVIVFGCAAVVLLRDRRGLIDTVASSSLWEPVGFYALIPRPADHLIRAALPFALLLCVAACFGTGRRQIVLPAGLLGAYVVGISNNLGKVNHDRNVLVMALLVLAFSPPMQHFHPERSPEHRWPTAAIQLGYGLMFGFAAFSKVWRSGFEWITSENMRNILASENLLLPTTTLPDVSLLIASQPVLWQTAALATVVGEAGLLLAVLIRRPAIRYPLIALAAALVAGLNLLMRVGGWVLLGLLPVLINWDDVWGLRRRTRTIVISSAGSALALVTAFHSGGRLSLLQAGLVLGLTAYALNAARRTNTTHTSTECFDHDAAQRNSTARRWPKRVDTKH